MSLHFQVGNDTEGALTLDRDAFDYIAKAIGLNAGPDGPFERQGKIDPRTLRRKLEEKAWTFFNMPKDIPHAAAVEVVFTSSSMRTFAELAEIQEDVITWYD